MGAKERNPAAVGGWVMFAGAVMFVVGVFDVIQGLVALFKEEVYIIPSSGLVVSTDYTLWGWALLIWGIILVLGALSLFSLSEAGRWFALVVVAINMIGQFAWFPAYPLWSLIVIILSAAVLWALTVGWSALGDE